MLYRTPTLLPHRIEQGVLLERSGILLPWWANVPRLKGELAPGDSGSQLSFRDESVLGGLGASVSVVGLGVLQVVALSLDIDEGYSRAQEDGGVVATHMRGVRALAQTFGPPTDYSPGQIKHGPAHPAAIWNLPGFRIERMVSDRNGMIWQTRIERRRPDVRAV